MSNVAGRDAWRQSPVQLATVDRKPDRFIYAPTFYGYIVIEPCDDRSFATLREVMKAYAMPDSGGCRGKRRDVFYDAVLIHNYLATGQHYLFQSGDNPRVQDTQGNYGYSTRSHFLVTISENGTLHEEVLFNEAAMDKPELCGALINYIDNTIQKLASLFVYAKHPADFETLSKAAIYLTEKRLEITCKMEAS